MGALCFVTQSMMSRRVKQYLSNLTVIQDEENLREMSNVCEPPQGSGKLTLSFPRPSLFFTLFLEPCACRVFFHNRYFSLCPAAAPSVQSRKKTSPTSSPGANKKDRKAGKPSELTAKQSNCLRCLVSKVLSSFPHFPPLFPDCQRKGTRQNPGNESITSLRSPEFLFSKPLLETYLRDLRPHFVTTSFLH